MGEGDKVEEVDLEDLIRSRSTGSKIIDTDR